MNKFSSTTVRETDTRLYIASIATVYAPLLLILGSAVVIL